MNDNAVTICEWETVGPGPSNSLRNRSLRDGSTRRLAAQLAEQGSIEVLELSSGLEIRAKSFVGRLTLGDLTITVQPKIPGAPLISLLRYAYGLRQLDLYQDAEYVTRSWAFQDLLIKQLAAEAFDILTRGLHRDYVRTPANLANPRGRIDFDRAAGLVYRAAPTLPCIDHPRIENTLLNQVVLAGLARSTQVTTDTYLRAYVARLTKTLSEAVSSRNLNSSVIALAARTVDRRTTAYLPALRIIDLLLQHAGASLEKEGNNVRLPGFLFDMNQFFQALMSRFLHQHLEHCEVRDEHRLQDFFRYDPALNPKRRKMPIQKPDFAICRRADTSKIVAILDAKYRDLWETSLPSEMLYQLSLYALAQRGDRRQAVILYPTLNNHASDQAIQLLNPDTGAPQAGVILRPVNLLALEALVHRNDPQSRNRKALLATEFVFGKTTDLQNHQALA